MSRRFAENLYAVRWQSRSERERHRFGWGRSTGHESAVHFAKATTDKMAFGSGDLRAA
jgi:hypothetical protein